MAFVFRFGRELWGLVVGVTVLDLGVQTGHVANQMRIYGIDPGARSRLNTVYMVTYFACGAVGSAMGAAAWARFGWMGVCVTGFTLSAAAGLVMIVGRRGHGPGHGRIRADHGSATQKKDRSISAPKPREIEATNCDHAGDLSLFLFRLS